MNIAKTMYLLQNNVTMFYLISTVVVLGVYIFVSTKILLSSRSMGEDVCTSCYIPVVNIFMFISSKHKVKKAIKMKQKKILEEQKAKKEAEANLNSEFEGIDEDEEIDIF